MLYYIRGKDKVDLSDSDFIAKGGEGKVYGKNDTIYKIYKSADKIKENLPEAKIRELYELTLDNILKPLDIILTKNNQYIGFTMKWIKNTYPMCQLFTNDLWDVGKLNYNVINKLIIKIIKTVKFTHKKHCLIVDANEFNFLASKDFLTPYFIDVNCYKTKSFPPTALMLSVKDFHTKGFSELTDWFSLSILIFQLYCGIHPFKGGHPRYKKGDFKSRMIDNVSVLNKDVKLPPTVRSINNIPDNFKKWFFDLYEKGKRCYPPDIPGEITTIKPTTYTIVKGDDLFSVDFIKEFDDIIIDHNVVCGKSVVTTRKSIYIDNIKYRVDQDVGIVFTERKTIPILVKFSNKDLKLKPLQNYEIRPLNLKCDNKAIINNTLYIKNDGKLTEVELSDMLDTKVIPCVSVSWNIMPHSSKIFKVIYQEGLNNSFLTIPLSKKSCITKKIPELNGYRIIDAKYSLRVCMLIGYKNNRYDKIIIKFDKNCNLYNCRINENIACNQLNFITLDHGVVVSIEEDGLIEVFFNDIYRNEVKKIHSKIINQSMKLFKNGTSLLFSKNNKLYSLSMKK